MGGEEKRINQWCVACGGVRCRLLDLIGIGSVVIATMCIFPGGRMRSLVRPWRVCRNCNKEEDGGTDGRTIECTIDSIGSNFEKAVESVGPVPDRLVTRADDRGRLSK